jgi:DNA processing protein
VQLLLRGAPDYPPLLEQISDPPPLLYVLGDVGLLLRPAVAIVGTRRPSREGLLFAEGLAFDLARQGLIVVSGLAFGIDAAAHRGALAAGRTVAVLASGVDVPSPRGNRDLYDQVLKGGAVVSELAGGSHARAHQYLSRNRIISGLALGTVVVEARQRSGALTTARHAREQDREVFAVPSSPLRETSAGPNALIKDGAALVRGWEDVVAELQPQLSPSMTTRLACSENSTGERTEAPGRAQTERGVLRLLNREPIHIDALQAADGREVSRLLAELSELEIMGAVRQLPGKYFIRA